MKSIHTSLITFIAGLGTALAQTPGTAMESPLIEHPTVGEDRRTLEWGVQNCSEEGDGTTPPFFTGCEFVIRKETGDGVFQEYFKILETGEVDELNLRALGITNEIGELRMNQGFVGSPIIEIDDEWDNTLVTSNWLFTTGAVTSESMSSDFMSTGDMTATNTTTDFIEVGWFDLIGGGGSINMNQGSGGGPMLVVDGPSSNTTIVQGNITTTGMIEAAEVKTAKWRIATPDYVFEPDFQLKPLPEVEEFVRENKHLPDIPSGKEFEKEGLELATMSMLLLKKVEELTLYTIDQDKVIRAQHQNIAEQKAQLDELRRQVTALLKEGK